VAALICTTSLLWPGLARSDVPLYEVTVPLGGPTEEDRARAIAEALQAVAVKASGRRSAATSGTVAAANPARYVQRYAKTSDEMLKVGFDGRAVEELLQQAGLPLWPSERPLVVVAAAGVDRAEIERAAAWRGLPIAWDSGGAGASATLSGVPATSGFVWKFTHAGETNQARGSAQDGIDLAADTLAAIYAPPSTRSTSALSVSVSGVRDVTAYATLVSYLRSLSMVRDLTVEALTGDVIRLRVTVIGDRQLLMRIAALDGRLLPADRSTDPAEADADFLFQP
jgi:hypothetical protein